MQCGKDVAPLTLETVRTLAARLADTDSPGAALLAWVVDELAELERLRAAAVPDVPAPAAHGVRHCDTCRCLIRH
jgi:hypothetical protein